jgi:SnoaL-like polyketide cyclase
MVFAATQEAPMATGASRDAQSIKAKLQKYEEAEELASIHLAKFDDLDFNVFSNQDWVRLHESHAENILVYWPDGRRVRGIKQHIEDLSAMFVYAPDTRIKVHPVKIGVGAWTSVIGEMEGTFTKHMPAASGKLLAPTGKTFKIMMCTVGHWKDGVMDEEYLFWDNLTFMKQIGLA